MRDQEAEGDCENVGCRRVLDDMVKPLAIGVGVREEGGRGRRGHAQSSTLCRLRLRCAWDPHVQTSRRLAGLDRDAAAAAMGRNRQALDGGRLWLRTRCQHGPACSGNA